MRRSPPGGDKFFKLPREEREPGKLSPSDDTKQGDKTKDDVGLEEKVQEDESVTANDLDLEAESGNKDKADNSGNLGSAFSGSRSLGMGELATAYVPWQVYTRIASPGEAHPIGTIFPELARTPPLYKRPRE